MSDSFDASQQKDDFFSIKDSRKGSNIDNEMSNSKFGAMRSAGRESKFKKRVSRKMKGRESNRNKDTVDIPTINSIEIFGKSCNHPAPSDFTNWFLSKVNMIIKPKEIIPEAPDQEEIENIKTIKAEIKNEHYPFFESLRYSNITVKGGNTNIEETGGEMIGYDTKVNLYLLKYNIVLVLDYSASMNNIDSSSGKMYFQKMREVVAAILFNLK